MVFLALASFGQDLYDITHSGDDLANDEYLASMGFNNFADVIAVAVVCEKAMDSCNNISRYVPKAEAAKHSFSYILIFLGVVDAFALMAGWGEPYAGDDLRTGSKQVAALDELLACALPDERWTGDSAETYADDIRELRLGVQKLVDADKNLGGCAEGQAQIVLHTRLALGILKNLLLLAYSIEWWYYAEWDPVKIEEYEFQVCKYGAGTLTAILTVLPGFLSRIPGANRQANRYWNTAQAVLQGADRVWDAPAVAGTAVAEETKVAGFEDILAKISAIFESDGTASASTSLTATSRQPEQTQAYAYQRLSPVNQATAPAQRPAPMAAPGRRQAGAPTSPPLTEGDVHGTEADAGTWALDRAPVDVVPVGSKQGEFAWQI